MTQEEKQLLLKDLCARLPYHPFFIGNKHDIMPLYNVNTYVGIIDCIPAEKIEDCRLYLRPMDSMTEEELDEYLDGKYTENIALLTVPNPSKIDWLNAHHFDHRCLIPMGLALPATEGMYQL